MRQTKKIFCCFIFLLCMSFNCYPVLAMINDNSNSKIVINEFEEITDNNQLIIRAKKGINESNHNVPAIVKYVSGSSQDERTSIEYELPTTTQLLSTYIQNGQLAKSYAVTVFADLSSSAIDPQNLMKLTLYYIDVGGFLTFRYSSVALLTTSSFPSLIITNTVYEGMETGIAHTNTNVFPHPSGISTLNAPTSLPIGGGLASLTAEARLNLFNGSYTYCIIPII